MKTAMFIGTFTCLSLLIALPAAAGGIYGSVTTGYTGGLGVDVAATIHEFTRDLPLSARMTLGYNNASAGDPYDARQVFINDNTNGDPEKSAKSWQIRFDLLFPAFTVGPQQLYVFAGPRYARYKANFNYIGGNENFDVTSNSWGAGGGFESWFAVSDRTDFVLQLGFDWYSDAEISGHDTSYLPSGDHVNPRDGYDYASADDAIDQPKYELLGMMGLRFEF
ncbi:MAG: hypothetical protein GY838_06050 [bacterium]|nr:hypothetical protein [bacterium]